jgi:hypothetical protein
VGGGKPKEGGKRGKNVSAYAIADDLEMGKKLDPGQAGWVAEILRMQGII